MTRHVTACLKSQGLGSPSSLHSPRPNRKLINYYFNYLYPRWLDLIPVVPESGKYVGHYIEYIPNSALKIGRKQKRIKSCAKFSGSAY